MNTILMRHSVTAATAALAIGAVPALAAPQGAKLSMEQARQVAFQAYPGGKIMKQELERERGGSGLRYSFDMKQGKSWREVGVDAVSGRVLENKAEGAYPKD